MGLWYPGQRSQMVDSSRGYDVYNKRYYQMKPLDKQLKELTKSLTVPHPRHIGPIPPSGILRNPPKKDKE